MDEKTKRAAAAILLAIGDVIKELGEVPSGHLYARLMGHMSLDSYNKCIAALKDAGLVTESNYVLRWVG